MRISSSTTTGFNAQTSQQPSVSDTLQHIAQTGQGKGGTALTDTQKSECATIQNALSSGKINEQQAQRALDGVMAGKGIPGVDASGTAPSASSSSPYNSTDSYGSTGADYSALSGTSSTGSTQQTQDPDPGHAAAIDAAAQALASYISQTTGTSVSAEDLSKSINGALAGGKSLSSVLSSLASQTGTDANTLTSTALSAISSAIQSKTGGSSTDALNAASQILSHTN